jgi:hypothetical protein
MTAKGWVDKSGVGRVGVERWVCEAEGTRDRKEVAEDGLGSPLFERKKGLRAEGVVR